eukprot:5133261-Alexandrium_andersonii.AAC.1
MESRRQRAALRSPSRVAASGSGSAAGDLRAGPGHPQDSDGGFDGRGASSSSLRAAQSRQASGA